MRFTTTAVAIAFVVPALLPAQAPPRDFAARVDRFVKEEMTRQQLVGLSLAVFKDGKLVLERGYGFANLEHKVPATPATIYQSGSVGKQFTAAGIMRAKSYVTVFAAIAPSMPRMTRSAASFHFIWRNIISPERITEPGFTLSWPAYFGAVPCVASKMAWPVT